MADSLGGAEERSVSSPDIQEGQVGTAALQCEIHRLGTNVKVTAAAQFVRAHAWSRVGLILNVMTASLVALVGVSQLADLVGPVSAGIGALAAAGLIAISTALGADKKAAAAAEAANAYIEIRDALWQLAHLDLPTNPSDEIRGQIKLLTERIHAVNKSAEPPGWLARRRALRDVLGRSPHEGQAAAPQEPRG